MLARLRRETRAEHEAIERRVPSIDPAGPGLTIETYYSFLARAWGFYGPIEAAIERRLGGRWFGLDVRRRRKVALLARDLSVLGLPAAEVRALPRCAAIPMLDGEAEAAGGLYVLEGATLGGRILARQVATRLGIDREGGGLFLDGYGLDTADMWRSFGAALTQFAAAGARELSDRVVRGARDTFTCYDAWLAAPRRLPVEGSS